MRTAAHEPGEPVRVAYAHGRHVVFVLDGAHAAHERHGNRGVAFCLVAREVREVAFERAAPVE